METKILPTNLEIYAPEEHIPNIERSVKTIKEKCRVITHSVPYNRYTKLMTIGLIENANHWLNAFPTSSRIVGKISPAQIVKGTPQPDYNHQRIPFGSHAMVYTKTTNNMKARSMLVIALTLSNQSGGYYFMSLYSGKKLHSYERDELLIDRDIIDRVEQLASAEIQPKLVDGLPLFK